MTKKDYDEMKGYRLKLICIDDVFPEDPVLYKQIADEFMPLCGHERFEQEYMCKVPVEVENELKKAQ